MRRDGVPTWYGGVLHRSRLEARTHEWIDASGVACRYQPEPYVAPLGEWWPDFGVYPVEICHRAGELDVRGHRVTWPARSEIQPVLIETKPTWPIVEDEHALEAVAVAWHSSPDAWVMVAVPGGAQKPWPRHRAPRGLFEEIHFTFDGWSSVVPRVPGANAIVGQPAHEELRRAFGRSMGPGWRDIEWAFWTPARLGRVDTEPGLRVTLLDY